MLFFVQWNARSLKRNLPFLFEHCKDRFDSTPLPAVILLQETFLNNSCGSSNSEEDYSIIDDIFSLPKSYKLLNVNKRFSTGIKRGGVAILLHCNDTDSPVSTFELLQIDTSLECIAVKVSFASRFNITKPITFVSLYHPTTATIPGSRDDDDDDEQLQQGFLFNSQKTLESLFKQLPDPFIFGMDSNLHHPIWEGSNVTSNSAITKQANIFANWFTRQTDIALLNEPGVVTFKRNEQCTSVIDLSLASLSLIGVIDWQIEQQELCGSDHFPIFITLANNWHRQQPSPNTLHRVTNWDYSKANWDLFKSLSALPQNFNSVHNYPSFTRFLNTIATTAIPLIKPPKILSEREKAKFTNQFAWWTKGNFSLTSLFTAYL